MIRCSFGSKNLRVTDLSLFSMELITSKIAKQAALLPLEIVEEQPTAAFEKFKQMLEAKHRLASLILSDAADFGAGVARNAKINLAKPHRSLLDLKNALKGIPAVLVGAGPSLEENGHLLPEHAIIFAGGHALQKLKRAPHFGALIDKNPLEFTNTGFPLCIQPRVSPVDGEILMAPDSHFPILGETFDGGWTVGNFMAAIAVYFGCNPIICVGMDYCTRAGKKYAFDDRIVDSQEDWLASVEWLKNLSKNHPQTTFLNASKGLQYFTPCNLRELKFEAKPIHDIIRKAIESVEIKTDVFSAETMLPSLWEIWEPVFARAGDFSEKQMKMHQDLFFEQVRASYD